MPRLRLRTFHVEIVYASALAANLSVEIVCAAATAAKLFQRVVGMGVRKNDVSFSPSLTLDYSSTLGFD